MRTSVRTMLLMFPLAASMMGCAAGGRSFFAMEKKSFNTELSMARMCEKQNQSPRAREIYEGVLKADKKCVEAHHRLGLLAGKNGEFEEAAQHFDEALKHDPKNIEILLDKGYVQYLQDDLPGAEATVREVLTQVPKHQRAHVNLGMILARQENYSEAREEFRSVLSESEACSNLGFAMLQAGRVDEAKAELSRALSLDPKNRKASESLVQLAGMERDWAKLQQSGAQKEAITKADDRQDRRKAVHVDSLVVPATAEVGMATVQ